MPAAVRGYLGTPAVSVFLARAISDPRSRGCGRLHSFGEVEPREAEVLDVACSWRGWQPGDRVRLAADPKVWSESAPVRWVVVRHTGLLQRVLRTAAP